jgi:4-amino-4-deoxy-L-arabinose transferase-like glycosyltransferase
VNLRRDRFATGLVVITALALAIRLVYALGFRWDYSPFGDPHFYHYGANLLADGKGFIQPFLFLALDTRVEAADHPPLYMLFLALPSVLGLDTVHAHLAWSALLGSATVAVTGVLGRVVAGARTGLVAAAIVAVAPSVWVYDGQLLSETMALLCATAAVLLAYRALAQPSVGRLAALGLACGAAALSRSELVLLVPALCWPVAALARAQPPRARLGLAALATAIAVGVTLPWIAYNLTRFEHPVLLSSQLEATLAGANCDDTYEGRQLGLITSTCLGGLDPLADQSVNGRILRTRAREFVADHASRAPVVAAARVGRVLGVYRPGTQIDADVALEGRERPVAVAGLLTGYLLTIGAVAGAVVLNRRRTARLFPLLVLPAIVIVTVALTYGTTRFRASAETSLAILAAVAIDALWRRAKRDRSALPG